LKLLKNDRCKICKVNRGNRFCLRIGKDICWQCCNEKRIDFKCSDACRYSLQKTETFEYKTNTDSKKEYEDLLKKSIERWMNISQEIFQNKIPREMLKTEEGKKEIEDLFLRLNITNPILLNLFNVIFKLDNPKAISKKETHEDIAQKYLDKIIEQDWQATIQFLYRNRQYENQEYRKNYLKRLSTNNILKKLTDYELISSALSEDRKQALVYLDINRKFDLTLRLGLDGENWKIDSKIFGKPEICNGENDAIKQVAMLLAKKDFSKAFTLIKKYSSIFVDSADFQYYWGLYYTFTHNNKKLKEHFRNAVEIDPTFVEAKYNLAYVYHSEGDIEKAKQLYYEIIKISPEDIKSLNNLGSILIDEGKHKEAKQFLQKCLKIDKDFEIARKNLKRLEELEK